MFCFINAATMAVVGEESILTEALDKVDDMLPIVTTNLRDCDKSMLYLNDLMASLLRALLHLQIESNKQSVITKVVELNDLIGHVIAQRNHISTI